MRSRRHQRGSIILRSGKWYVHLYGSGPRPAQRGPPYEGRRVPLEEVQGGEASAGQGDVPRQCRARHETMALSASTIVFLSIPSLTLVAGRTAGDRIAPLRHRPASRRNASPHQCISAPVIVFVFG